MAKKKSKGNHVPLRLNWLFFAVFILFSILILRLGYIQIVNGEDFLQDVESTSADTARIDAPRGLMYDRNGNIMVDNELVLTLTYTSQPDVSSEEKVRIAEKLSQYMDMDIEGMRNRIRDLKDYWLVTNREKGEALLEDEDYENAEDDSELYQLQLDRIPTEQLEAFSDEELEVIAIWREMNRGYHGSPHPVKKGVGREEAHQISERLDELPGVDIVRGADRKYLYEDAFPRFFGRTGSIPHENLDEYLAHGYERSDEVGTSFLEEEYEMNLRGEKGSIEDGYNSNSAEANGSRGQDLILSIDIELQQQLEDIIDEEVDSAIQSFINDPMSYAIMIEPKTGEILAVSGYDDHLGTVSKSFEMGSTVKPATVMAGLQTGVIQPGTVIYDQPIKLPSTPTIRSVSVLGRVNDVTAIERSSNIYMAEIAMRLAEYHSGSWNLTKVANAFDTLRYYYHQFGLGVQTYIDLPFESTGINGGIGYPGNLLYMSFGQYDTYTPMQLAQYVATIANGGYRMQPRLVKEIRQANPNKNELGSVLHQFEPNILNKIDIDQNYMERAQQGMWRVVNGSQGTARHYFQNTDYEAAGKTGTAEIRIRQDGSDRLIDGNNQTFIGYAPYEDPEVAVAVVTPYLYKTSDGGTSGIANRIARKALDAYFDMKEKRPALEDSVLDEGVVEDQP